MDFITGKHLSRRTFLHGTGASLALPFLDAMVPAGRVWRDPAQGFTRLICLEEDLGHAAGNAWGDAQYLFGPEKLGRGFELVERSSLKQLEEYREYLTIVSNTDCRMGEPLQGRGDCSSQQRNLALPYPGPCAPQVGRSLPGEVHRPGSRGPLWTRYAAPLTRAHHRNGQPRRGVRVRLSLRV